MLFSMQYFILSREKQYLTVKQNFAHTVYSDVTMTLIIVNKRGLASEHLNPCENSDS